MKFLAAVVLVPCLAACGSGGNGSATLPDAPATCAGTPHDDPEGNRLRRWQHIAEQKTVDDLWMGFGRLVDLARATTMGGPTVKLRSLVVVYPYTGPTYIKGNLGIIEGEGLEQTRTRLQERMGSSFTERGVEDDVDVRESLRRLRAGDIPVGAVRLAGPHEDLVRLVRANRCLVHALHFGETSGRPEMSKEASPD